jgi:deoxyribonuclease V
MLLAIDTQYGDQGSVTAGVLFEAWTDAGPVRTLTTALESVNEYQPGELYRRELPPILNLLGSVPEPVDVILIDGYVWLDGAGRPGLGAHLYEAVAHAAAIVGVAKSAFQGSKHAEAIYRGGSGRPLYVTAAGCDPMVSAEDVRRMHGAHRLPTLLKLADRLARRGLP